MSQTDTHSLWQRCSDILRDNMSGIAFNTWFAPLEVIDYKDDVLVLRAKSQFVVEYIEENYIDILSRSIRHVFGEKTRLEYRVLIDSVSGAGVTVPSTSRGQSPVTTTGQSFDTRWDAQLNKQYTFESFVMGESNRLARTAAVAIAKDPGKTAFNPFFIYGGSGVGKTHLANATGNEITALNPSLRVLYVSANTFKLQYQQAAIQKTIPDFLLFYQNVDVLIVDDIQFFTGLKGTQDTFFHIFEYLIQSRKQLILTSDRTPLQIHDVQERLLTRFKWGLSVEIKRPDFELRREILRYKMHCNGMQLPDEIVDYIAQNACQNVRDIEGVLASLVAYSTLLNADIDLRLVNQVINQIVEVEPKQIMMADIIGTVCEHSDVTEKAVLGQSRQKDVVRARQLIIHLAKRLTNHSLTEIGNSVKRSHATVLHSLNTLSCQMEYDSVLRHDAELLESVLRK
ncbi:MAG: chromosomal replication initiator protein DnaA [Paludibacteraceae bacterium]|nr:chromosomal replication initiator protein DnaA [Paludibacteraceae bacterium]